MVREAALIALLLSSGVKANPILWGKIEIDMPFEQARAAYPDATVNPSSIGFKEKVEGCSRNVIVFMDRKVSKPDAKVKEVELLGTSCATKIFAELLAKYGEPLELHHGDSLGLDNGKGDFDKTARWVSDGRSILYESQGDIIMTSWQITYAPVRDRGL